MTDELSITSLRQTATLPITMPYLWLIDVASSIIAAYVRGATG